MWFPHTNGYNLMRKAWSYGYFPFFLFQTEMLSLGLYLCFTTTWNCRWRYQQTMFIARSNPPSPQKNKHKNPTTHKTKVKRCQIRHCDIKLVIHIEKPPDWGSFKMQKYFGDPSVQVCLRYTVFLADQTPSLVAVKHTQRYKHAVCAAAAQRQK